MGSAVKSNEDVNMSYPICLSQNFVNKQNVRSFSNVIKKKSMENKNFASLLLDIEEEKLGALSSEFLGMLFKLNEKLQQVSKDDFKQYFISNNDNSFLEPVSKSVVFLSCWTGLMDIIPNNFFGVSSNMKIFRELIQTVICSFKGQHIELENIFNQWDFSLYLWKTLEDNAQLILLRIIIGIIRYILSAMICLNFYVTTCKIDADENKLLYFWKNQWQSFFDKKISDMLVTKVLTRYDPVSICSQHNGVSITKFEDSQRLKEMQKQVPKLRLILKRHYDFRPIVSCKSDKNVTEKLQARDTLKFLKFIAGTPPPMFEIQYQDLYNKWVNMNKPKLYFVRTDLTNAFGAINKDHLMKILCEKYYNCQNVENNKLLKLKLSQQYRQLLTELQKPMLVRAGNTVYEWTEGLLQGHTYSPALSELYYSHLDEHYFAKHLEEPDGLTIKLFVRVVDDYLYITDSLLDAHLFLNALANFKNVNYDKTEVNFEHDDIQFNDKIKFLGHIYDTETLEVTRAKNSYEGQMCYKISFTAAVSNLNKFIESRIGQSSVQISSHIFNFIYNSEATVWEQIFITYCISANKFCTILAIYCQGEIIKNYLNLYKKKVAVKLTNAILLMLIKNKPSEFTFMYCINHFKYLCYKSLLLCAQKTPKCNLLVPLINEKLAKCNCIFGKWRDHASKLSSNGESLFSAERGVCTRIDLRHIFSKFNRLPDGFECYDEKKLTIIQIK